MLKVTTGINPIPVEYLHILLRSALEFRSNNASVELYVEGPESSDDLPGEIEIEIEILLGKEKERLQEFQFYSTLAKNSRILLGDRLSTSNISLPCEVILSGDQEIELTAPVEIYAEQIQISAKILTLKHAAPGIVNKDVVLQADTLKSSLETVFADNVSLKFILFETKGLTYPVVQHAEKIVQLPSDKLIAEKYTRLRRILMQFRSHSKGSLAKYKDKIESDRVLRNEVGRSVLRKLIKDKILVLQGVHYHLDPQGIDTFLGVSWIDLRLGRTSDKLVKYLQAIQ